MPTGWLCLRIATMRHVRNANQIRLCAALTLAIVLSAARPAFCAASAPAATASRTADKLPGDSTANPPNVSQAAIGLTHRERMALAKIRDGQTSLDETAFYLMLARTRRLADDQAAAKSEFPDLETPAIGNLSDYPSRYRAQKLRMMVRVYTCRKIVSGDPDLHPQPAWPKGKTLWRMHGYHASGASGKIEDVIVFSLVDPTAALGKPVSVNDYGEALYSRGGRELKLAGLFYKLLRAEAESSKSTSPLWRDYPVVLGYYLERAAKSADRTPPFLTAAIALLVVLAFGFIMMKRHVRRLRGGAPGKAGMPAYQATRDSNRQQGRTDYHDDKDGCIGPVDPDLVDAVRKHTTERQQSDGTDSKN